MKMRTKITLVSLKTNQIYIGVTPDELFDPRIVGCLLYFPALNTYNAIIFLFFNWQFEPEKICITLLKEDRKNRESFQIFVGVVA